MTAHGRHGIIVTRQAGTAAAFAPLLPVLEAQRPDLDLTLYCYPGSDEFAGNVAHTVRHIKDFADARDSLARLGQVEFVLTGTSEHVADDCAWWSWARQRGIRSTGFVDQWVNYWQRFTTSRGNTERFDHVPDRIAVVDAVARRRLADLGCTAESIIETGSPALDDVLSAPATAGDAIRERFHCRGGDILLLYACESEWPEEWRAKGFDTFAAHDQSLGLACQAALDCDPGVGRDVVLLVKPHPRQKAAGETPDVATGGVRIQVCDGDRVAMLHAADIVLGVHTMLLYEASVLGKPVISIQPGKRGVCDLTDGRPGIAVVENARQLATALDEAIARVASGAGRKPARAPGGSHAERFLDALGMLRRGAP